MLSSDELCIYSPMFRTGSVCCARTIVKSGDTIEVPSILKRSHSLFSLFVKLENIGIVKTNLVRSFKLAVMNLLICEQFHYLWPLIGQLAC